MRLVCVTGEEKTVKTIAPKGCLRPTRTGSGSMDLEARLDHWERRQEDLIATLHAILDGVDAMRGQLGEVVAWLQQPPSDDLPELIRALIAANDATQAQLARLETRVEALPAAVAQAVAADRGSGSRRSPAGRLSRSRP